MYIQCVIYPIKFNSVLMKEPVLQDKRSEHVKFCKYANELIERVSGKIQHANIDASLDRIRKVIALFLHVICLLILCVTLLLTKLESRHQKPIRRDKRKIVFAMLEIIHL